MLPPRTNLECLLFGGAEGKVACESFAGGGSECVDDPPSSTSFEAPFIAGVYHPDGYHRKESTKGLANPKSAPAAANRKPGASSAAAAAAAAGRKPPVLALPAAKIQTTGHARPTRGRIFPKKKGRRNPAVPEAEPGSPKVDCFGKVLSGSERGRRQPGTGEERGRRQPGTGEEREARGCWAGFVGVLRWVGCRAGGWREAGEKEVRVVDRRSLAPSRSIPAETVRGPLAEVEEEEEQRAPNAMSLGSMRAYTSSRRTASWGEEAEQEARNPGSGHHS